ncbi:Uncharacterized protein TXXE_13770 [Thermobacillus xylanilyticus]|jgi:hypothetical protein|uniref:DUF4227 domain-containing protein n=1 Tax=Thermobacillus xylanilyticus TaxID=76633 RepID=A0ABM8V680_THEXY|nr:DUF4227 family protein [Thermobacillus xylanilyticus]CAG5090046.1 Uncharacterized protein TXXE_13770 [Thermobacillus xylanilyticus]
MVVSLRRMLRRLLFAALFLVLTLVIAAAFRLLAEWLRMPDPYAAPLGRAVKVFVNDPDGGPSPSVLDRLRLFYLTGD